jgi:hypothetical protein
MSSKITKIKKDTAIILELSTVHAIPNIIRSEKMLLKIIWTVFLLISIAACSYCVTKSFTEYFSYETVSKIEVFYEEKTEFPAISMCSRTATKYDDFKFFNATINLDGENVTNSLNLFYDPLLKTCYRLNEGKNLNGDNIPIWKSISAGRTYGLNLDLYIPSIHLYTEIYLNIHNKTNPPLNIEKSIRITSGTDYYFTINRLFSEKLGEPFNNCLKNVEIFKNNKTIINIISKMKRTYNQNECFELCRGLILTETNVCNCSDSNIGQVVTKCYDISQKECIVNFLKYFDTKKCFDYCPLECDSNVLTISQYSSSLPRNGNTTDIFRYYYELKTFEEVSKGYFGINIFYEQLGYTLISESESLTVYDLVSNIGGILGLFLGISFLSIIEIVEILIQIIYILLPN